MDHAEGCASTLTLHSDRLIRNARAVASHLTQGTRLMAVVKANAYGHGLEATARAIEPLDEVAALAVSAFREAAILRKHGVRKAILILGPTACHHYPRAAAAELSLTIHQPRQIDEMAWYAHQAVSGTLSVHLKVDTGLHRLGFSPSEIPGLVEDLANLQPSVKVSGLYSHFHSADVADLASAKAQLDRFRNLVADLERRNLRPALCHIANTAATLRMPDAHMDMVRVGGALYGLNPNHKHCPLPEPFLPALSWHTEVVQVHEVPTGAALGYGHCWQAPRPSRIAVLPVGYADGLPRNRPREVLIRGQTAPLVGTRSMNMAFADTTAIGNPPVQPGERATLVGAEGGNTLYCDRIADLEGTIEYEVTARIPASHRILRACAGESLPSGSGPL
ncbi:MAG: alanine racemase [Caldilineaceae bacterium SB0662_bin_9]|uniref:Alanine racemase n=1 Tax=Caldilineaceae bacterium SB0662_bin_9 TaxID=2605258 RepID=A0A6B1DSU7_9CHLR|nr:alanine racemase [Caldilineaceae bacterium SB0662_bin_9]